ncbi:MAG: hypothetical protein AAGC55_06830 [Myxococcota bacterium]
MPTRSVVIAVLIVFVLHFATVACAARLVLRPGLIPTLRKALIAALWTALLSAIIGGILVVAIRAGAIATPAPDTRIGLTLATWLIAGTTGVKLAFRTPFITALIVQFLAIILQFGLTYLFEHVDLVDLRSRIL